jgi:hypothetical protein
VNYGSRFGCVQTYRPQDCFCLRMTAGAPRALLTMCCGLWRRAPRSEAVYAAAIRESKMPMRHTCALAGAAGNLDRWCAAVPGQPRLPRRSVLRTRLRYAVPTFGHVVLGPGLCSSPQTLSSGENGDNLVQPWGRQLNPRELVHRHRQAARTLALQAAPACQPPPANRFRVLAHGYHGLTHPPHGAAVVANSAEEDGSWPE